MCIDDGCIVESAKYATKQDLCKNRSDFAKKTQCELHVAWACSFIPVRCTKVLTILTAVGNRIK